MFTYLGSLVIDYKLKVLTGLRIGGSKENFEIGGLDNPVIKVVTEVPDYDGKGHTLPEGAPYIPGSSIKGKMRSLLEWVEGRVAERIENALKNKKKLEEQLKEAGQPCACGRCVICKIFGTGEAKTLENIPVNEQPGPPRLKVFDAYPTYETLERLKDALGEGIFTEIKTENQINRLTSRANPRKIERVPAGTEFEGIMVFDFYKEEDKELLKTVFQGMKRIEDNFLGGYGSRGSGKVKFREIKLTWKPKEFYKGEEDKKKELGEVESVEDVIKKLGEILGALK